ncbi:class I SAM-dependent methyltransferase [Alkanindiges sp. WGS2144]|uniref:class I SAM-dependent methyltransferase n=1 Tax=Alkanindiges sp. WGS2144 TaxID=3366808 RepID=UPI003750AE91
MQHIWSDGYVTDVAYTYGYYKDLSPTFQNFCLLLAGYDHLPINEHSYHCELGFGQGVSLNIHAAATLGTYIGTDFNPAHAAHANKLATAAGSQARIYDDSFEQLLARSDLPQFSSIGLHGIWSWISSQNQDIIVQFIKKYLKPGGMVYISYNCLPGISAVLPLKGLFDSYSQLGTTETNPITRIRQSLNFAQQLFSLEPQYVKAMPQVVSALNSLKDKDPYYLAHEYFNLSWQALSFRDVTSQMDAGKLQYASSTDLLTQVDSINLSTGAIEFLDNIENPILREQTRDYFFNRQFRKDLFIRGAVRLSQAEQKSRLMETPIVLLTTLNHIPKKITGHAGTFDLKPEIYEPFLKIMAADHYAPKTIGYLLQKLSQLNYEQVVDIILIMVGSGFVGPCQLPEYVQAVQAQCGHLNNYLIKQAAINPNNTVLSSPLLGAGFNVSRVHQLFLYAYMVKNMQQPAQWAIYCWEVLKSQGLVMIGHDQQKLEGDQNNLVHLQQLAKTFEIENFPILTALKILPAKTPAG